MIPQGGGALFGHLFLQWEGSRGLLHGYALSFLNKRTTPVSFSQTLLYYSLQTPTLPWVVSVLLQSCWCLRDPAPMCLCWHLPYQESEWCFLGMAVSETFAPSNREYCRSGQRAVSATPCCQGGERPLWHHQVVDSASDQGALQGLNRHLGSAYQGTMASPPPPFSSAFCST